MASTGSTVAGPVAGLPGFDRSPTSPTNDLVECLSNLFQERDIYSIGRQEDPELYKRNKNMGRELQDHSDVPESLDTAHHRALQQVSIVLQALEVSGMNLKKAHDLKNAGSKVQMTLKSGVSIPSSDLLLDTSSQALKTTIANHMDMYREIDCMKEQRFGLALAQGRSYIRVHGLQRASSMLITAILSLDVGQRETLLLHSLAYMFYILTAGYLLWALLWLLEKMMLQAWGRYTGA